MVNWSLNVVIASNSETRENFGGVEGGRLKTKNSPTESGTVYSSCTLN